MTIIVTGASGFIGANIVHGLNLRGETDIIAVDNLASSAKFKNLVDGQIADYFDKHEFLDRLLAGEFDGEKSGKKIRAIFHQGACSNTMESDGAYMMDNNYRYSLALLDFCQQNQTQFLYASSAATYGGSKEFIEEAKYEAPLNVYGYSKLLFDQIVRKRFLEETPDSAYKPKQTAQIVGFRYFNVYGPRESHKARMASVAFHHYHQFKTHRKVKLFAGCDGYANGEQKRDFVFVGDIVKANLFFFDHPEKSGIFNLGTGCAQSFNELSAATVNACLALEANSEGKAPQSLAELVKQGFIEYIPFPEDLRGKYQSFTEADLSQLRKAGYLEKFANVEEGVSQYVNWLAAKGE